VSAILKLGYSNLGYNGANLFINSTIADLTSVDSTERKITVGKLAINKKKNDFNGHLWNAWHVRYVLAPWGGGDQAAT
jgi:hypothetical protein